MGHYWFLLLLTVVFHYPLLLPDTGMPPWGDFYSFHSPMRIAAAEALHKGDMPFLTQALYGGYPLFSDPQFAFFYPVNFLFSLFVPNPNGEVPLDAYIFINLVVLSLSAVFFVRSFGFGRVASVVAAVLIAFNGFVQMHITHINILQVMATGYLASGLLMRMAWSGGRRWRLALGAGLALAAGNLAGHPQTTMFLHYAMGIGMVAVSYEIWRRTKDNSVVVRILGWSAVAVVVGVAIASVQLLPTAHLLKISARMHMERGEAMDEAIRLQHLPAMLFPGFYIPLRWQLGWPLYVPRHISWMSPNPLEALTFSGVVVFALGLLGFLGNLRRPSAHLLFWSAAFLLAASLGKQTPVYGWLYDYAPMVNKVRVPSRVLWLFYTAWALLAAMGIRLCLQRTAYTGSKRALLFVAAGLWIAILVVVAKYRTSWLDTFITVLIDDHNRYDALVRQQPEEFIRAIRDQLLIGGFFILCTFSWLAWVWRRGGSRSAAWSVTALVCLELFLYGFARSYIIDVPPTGVVEARPYKALPDKLPGRALVPNFVHGGGPVNMAMINGPWIANGYSVTYPTWVRAFEPLDVPPFRLGTEETLLDLWNVSDIVLRKRAAVAKMGPFDVPLDDWGWAEIGAQWTPASDETSLSLRGVMPSRLSVPLDDVTTPVVWIQVLCTSLKTFGMPDGTEVAKVYGVPRSAEGTTVTFSIRLGEDVAEANYQQEVERGNKPGHVQPPVALVRDALWEPSDKAQLYFAGLEMPTTAPLSELVFEATALFPASFAISQVLVGMEDGFLQFEMPHGLFGFEEAESLYDEYRVLHRDNAPGYAYMVPTAVRGSYKDPSNILWRMFTGGFDRKREVIVDKREYEPESAAKVDSPRPNDYEGTATIKWHQPEHVEVATKSNDQGWLVLSMTWDEGWSAWLDGEAVKLGRANGPFSALPVPAGEHKIILKYRPVNFVAGAVVSALATLGCLGAMLYRCRKGRVKG